MINPNLEYLWHCKKETTRKEIYVHPLFTLRQNKNGKYKPIKHKQEHKNRMKKDSWNNNFQYIKLAENCRRRTKMFICLKNKMAGIVRNIIEFGMEYSRGARNDFMWTIIRSEITIRNYICNLKRIGFGYLRA